MNQNENPFDLPDALKRELSEEFFHTSWNRYPDVFPTHLLGALSNYVNHPVEGIIAGNGSNELMYTILMATVSRGTKVLIPSPTFFLYEKAVKIFEGEVVEVLMNDELQFDTEKILAAAKKENPSLIILVSPNSPTGQSISIADVERILNGTSGIVVVDEAYIEFSNKQSAQSLVARYDRLIVLRTFSKAFSMAGLRIGYLLAQPALCNELLKPKIPFTVNNFSASIAIKLMLNASLVQERIHYIKIQKEFLYHALYEMKKVRVFPSDSNFLIFKTEYDAGALFTKLFDDNVLVRDVSSYPMLEKTLRVNAGTEEENKKFISVLHKNL